jgi:hypothetical protein
MGAYMERFQCHMLYDFAQMTVPLDPLSQTITLAIALGAAETVGKAAAAAAGKAVVSEIIKDAYGKLKSLISERFPKVPVDLLEDEPESEPIQLVVQQRLSAQSATSDQEILALSKIIVDETKKNQPAPESKAAIILRDFEARNVIVRGNRTSSGILLIEKAKVVEDILVENNESGHRQIEEKKTSK